MGFVLGAVTYVILAGVMFATEVYLMETSPYTPFKKDSDMDGPLCVAITWPVAAPLYFGMYAGYRFASLKREL